ncbi:uncharacterized protein mRpS34 [Planococcus citri]|uniref:uncharacterized protein mRpS34 n=1 Tax=Planococcus citri TaxID=170843 RepID=UPI0031F7283D
MVKYKYIGKPSHHCGKTLWEIIGNLKDYGVGRLVYRNTHSKYPQASFFKIVKCESVADTERAPGVYRKCIVWVDEVFRGMRYSEISEIFSASYKPDYRLIPKDEEHLWYEKVANIPKPEPFIPPTHIDVPPVLKIILNEDRKAKGLPVEEDMLTEAITIKNPSSKLYLRYVKELPEKHVIRGYGKSPFQELYDNIEEYKIKILNENKSD